MCWIPPQDFDKYLEGDENAPGAETLFPVRAAGADFGDFDPRFDEIRKELASGRNQLFFVCQKNSHSANVTKIRKDGLHEKVESIFFVTFWGRDLTKPGKCAACMLTCVSIQALVIEGVHRPKLQGGFLYDQSHLLRKT